MKNFFRKIIDLVSSITSGEYDFEKHILEIGFQHIGSNPADTVYTVYYRKGDIRIVVSDKNTNNPEGATIFTDNKTKCSALNFVPNNRLLTEMIIKFTFDQ